MIFATNNQLNCFILFIFFGLILGGIFQLLSIIFFKKYQKNWEKIVFESIFYTFFCIFFVILSNIFNFGLFSFALVLAYLIGFIWTNKLSAKLVGKIQNKWYNFLKGKAKNEKERKN